MPLTSPFTSSPVRGRSSRRISLASSVTVYGRCASSGFNIVAELTYVSDGAREMERCDAHPLVEIQAVGVGAVGPRPGIQVELVAVEALGLVDEPVHELACVALAPMLEPRAEVVAVQRMAPGQHMDDPESGHRDGQWVVLDEEARQAVALRPKDAVDMLGEYRLRPDVRSELQDRLVSEVGRPGVELLDHPPICDMFLAGLMNPGWLIK